MMITDDDDDDDCDDDDCDDDCDDDDDQAQVRVVSRSGVDPSKTSITAASSSTTEVR